MQNLAFFLKLFSLFVFSDSAVFSVRFTSTQGRYTIKSEGYPKKAPPFTNDIWRLSASPEERILLSCDELRFLNRLGCSEGSLTVWDGDSGDRSSICQTRRRFVHVSSGPILYVQFSTGVFGVGRARCTASVASATDMSPLPSSPLPPSPLLTLGDATTSCPCGWTNRERIVGGTVTGANEYPFVVSVTNAVTRARFCGGSILTLYHILSAAHCFHEIRHPVGVVAGHHDFSAALETSGSKMINVRTIIMHENYNHARMTNDIALLVLSEPLQYSRRIGPVCMPSARTNLVNRFVKVLGWGLTSDQGKLSDALREVDLQVIELRRCSNTYRNHIDVNNPTQICTYTRNKDSCQGDSGGPLVWQDPDVNRFVQVALVSYGTKCAADDPAVNTDVYVYRSWINTKIARSVPNVATCQKQT